MEICEKLKDLLKRSVLVPLIDYQKYNFDFAKKPFKSNIYLEKELVFVFFGIENMILYESVINEFYKSNNSVYNTVAHSQFEKYVSDLLFNWKMDEKAIVANDVKDIINHFLDIKAKEYLVIKGIFGIKLNDNNKEFSMGPFKVYYFPFYKQELAKKIKMNQEVIWTAWQHEYLVTITVVARDHEKAKEIAYNYFYQFELFLRYAIGHYDKKYCINIVSQITYKYDSCVTISEANISSPVSYDIIDIIPIDDPYYKDKSIGHEELWNLLSNLNNTQMQKRLITAIEWIGKANSEINIKNRFLFYIISIESVFAYHEKSLITPSIIYFLSESISLLLGNTFEERLEIEKIMKNLYEIRSALAHGSEKHISEEDIKVACLISVQIVRLFLTKVELAKVQTFNDLNRLIKELKYG